MRLHVHTSLYQEAKTEHGGSQLVLFSYVFGNIMLTLSVQNIKHIYSCIICGWKFLQILPFGFTLALSRTCCADETLVPYCIILRYSVPTLKVRTTEMLLYN